MDITITSLMNLMLTCCSCEASGTATADLYWFVWICIDLYRFIKICIDLYWFILIYINLYGFVLICMDLCWFICGIICVGKPTMRPCDRPTVRTSDRPTVRPSDCGPGSWAQGSHRIREDKQDKFRISKQICIDINQYKSISNKLNHSKSIKINIKSI